MTPKPEDLHSQFLALQGISLPPERAESLVRTLAAQLAAEREATRVLEFEVEPSSFRLVLEGGTR